MTQAGLGRFREAQEPVVAQVAAELAAGRKRTHWMWFVFPQLKGLGRSAMAEHYGIADLEEAGRYLDDPVLGARLRDDVRLVLSHGDRTAHAIFGSPDDMKFRSCLTLFECAATSDEDRRLFGHALELFYSGERDPLTLSLLASR